jgi:predicted DNA-binding ribbon-helix-helix protein
MFVMSQTKAVTKDERRTVKPGKQSDGSRPLTSRVVKRSILVGSHHTSVSLEDEFWNELRVIAHERNTALSQLVGELDAKREHGNLSSAIRLFVFAERRKKLEAKPPEP